ncbi:MAG: DUF721 domain-containing protein [Hyphomicrobiaceae bacterium]|nr:DUF721 domain-containing protein [Hyphomicrobiaceae bacterium]
MARVLIVNSTVATPRQPPRGVAGARRQPAVAVSSYVPRLTRKAFEKYGFASAALLTDWASIAGADIASYTAPERLKWPRGVDAYREVEAGAERRPGATLVLRVDGPRAIELQHKARQLVDRINASFGYRAVADLRFVQAPLAGAAVAAREPSVSSRPDRSAPETPELAAVEDEALRAALARLQASVHRDRARTAVR